MQIQIGSGKIKDDFEHMTLLKSFDVKNTTIMQCFFRAKAVKDSLENCGIFKESTVLLLFNAVAACD